MRARLIIFDLGGVLASLGRPAEQMRLGIAEEDFWSVWLSSATVRALETGTIKEHVFFERFPRELGLADTAQEFRQRFSRWRLELFPGVIELLVQLRDSRRIALLSNTNAIHWHMVDPLGRFRQLFHHVFLSFEIGQAKPAKRIFEHVLSAVPNGPGDIVFLDDTIKNVEVAASMGIQSTQVTGLDGVKGALSLEA